MSSWKLVGKNIQGLPFNYDVTQAVKELEQPDVWNLHRHRSSFYGTPHTHVDDIWVRYNRWENYEKDPVAFFGGRHRSVWYPVAKQLPSIKKLVKELLEDIGGGVLGGVLITRIPPGGSVAPHVDTGWHPEYYTKFAIQIKGNEAQGFCFDDELLSALPGQSYTFDNSKEHWVINESDEERITLIICIRPKDKSLRFPKAEWISPELGSEDKEVEVEV